MMEIISVLQIPLFACLLNCPADGLSMKNCAAAGRIFRPGRFQPQIVAERPAPFIQQIAAIYYLDTN